MNTSLIIHPNKYKNMQQSTSNTQKQTRPTTSINHYLSTFMPMLISLGADKPDNNIVLAGVNALKLHGLFMSRQANDLDVVLFKPTEEQINYLTNCSLFQIGTPFGHSQDYEPTEQKELISKCKQKSMKFEHKTLFLDILLTNDDLPHDLLYYKAFGIMFKIQNIALNIEAKKSYVIENRDGFSTYRREKDMKDFIDLKNSNFNF